MLIAITVTASALIAGCGNPATQGRTPQPEAQWGQVRSRIKLQLARRSLEQGLIDDAFQQCGEALTLDTESLDGLLLMAQICLEKGNEAQADAVLKHAALINEKHPDIYYFGGILAERRNRSQEAIDLYRQAYYAKPGELEYLLSYAMVLLHTGQPERALPLLKSRQKDFPDDAGILLLIGQALSLMDRKPEAAASLQQAVRLVPDNSLIRQEAGLALLDAGNVDEAMEVLAPLWVGPDTCSPGIIRCVAARLLTQDRAERAIRVLEPATAMHAKDASIWLLLAKACVLAGRPQDASRAAARAVQADEDSIDAKLMLAYASLAAGQKNQAAQVARQILSRHPRDAEAINIMSRTQ